MANLAEQIRQPAAAASPAVTPRTAAQTHGTTGREDLIWFVGVTVVGLLASYWYIYVLEGYSSDAIARVVHAHHILFSRDPHLAAIGFIWSPMQTMVELPFVLLLQPFRQSIFSASVISVVFSAGLAVFINRFLAIAIPGWNWPWRAALTLSILTNPLVAVAIVNGMTENPFLFFGVGAAYYLVTWRPGDLRGLMAAAILVGLSFLARYEAMAYVPAGIAGIALIATSRNMSREMMEASFTAFLAPFAFALMLWLMWNYLFVDDALYWVHAVGSNEQQTSIVRDPNSFFTIAEGYHSIAGTISYSFRHIVGTYPAFLPAMIVGTIAAFYRKDRPLLVLLVFAAAVPAFEVLQIYRGQLFTWVRYWIYLPPFAVIVAVFTANALLTTGRSRRRAYAVIVACAVLSSIPTAYAMRDPEATPDEQSFSEVLVSGDLSRFTTPQTIDVTMRDFRAITPTINRIMEEDQNALMMIDAYQYGPLVLLVDHPERFVISSDRDFERRMRDARTEIDYILIAPPVGQAGLTGANTYYPEMYGGGTPWARLVTEFTDNGKGRLYKTDGGGLR